MTDELLAKDGLPPLREVMRRNGIEPKRNLGQNFLFDLNLTQKIARAAGNIAEGTVIEVGPGPGGLTRALHALVHGDLGGALSMNPLAVLLIPLVPLMAAWGQGWQPRALRPVMAVVMEPKLWLVLLPAYWVARNLPWLPFTLLAPG